MQRESRREWALALIVALLTTIILFLPYCLGYWTAQPGTKFVGVIMNAEDSQSYFAKMLEGNNGNWLYTIPFTTEKHQPAFVGGFYILIGQLARVLGISVTAMWHAARLLADLILFLITFGFIKAILPKRQEYWTAYLLALFGSGLGWVLFLFQQTNWLGAFPVDFKMPEAHIFFAALTFPHVAFGMIFIIANMWCVMRIVDASSSDRVPWELALVGGVTNLLLAVAYPFLIYLVLLANLLYLFIHVYRARRILWKTALALGITYLVPAPLILYYARVLSTNGVFRAWDAQSITLSPHPLHYLVAYIVMIGLAFLASKRPRTDLLWTWILASALLVYAPLNPQRRFVEGVQIPLSILATCGVFDFVLPRIRSTKWFQSAASRKSYSGAGLERLLIIAFLGFMSLSNLYILTSVSTTTSVEHIYPFFRTTDEINAVEWLRANTKNTDVVLSSYETGNYIAAHAGNRVVIGHWAETLDYAKKLKEVNEFFSRPFDVRVHQSMLDRYGVSYIFWGPREKQAGQFDPSLVSSLDMVYENETVTLYRVIH